MLVTQGYDPGIYGPDKDRVDREFGSFNEVVVNDSQIKKRDKKEPIGHLGV